MTGAEAGLKPPFAGIDWAVSVQPKVVGCKVDPLASKISSKIGHI